MLPVDPLHTIEFAYILEESTSTLRHDVRNKLSSMRNMVFYLAKQAKRSNLWEADPRVPHFFTTLDSEVHVADQMLDQISIASAGVLATYPVSAVTVEECVNHALRCSRVASATHVDVAVEPLEVRVDSASLAVAIRALIENAAEAIGPDGRVGVVGRIDGTRYQIIVSDSGSGIGDPCKALLPFHTTKPGHIGLGLNVARRIAKRHRGDIVVSDGTTGVQIWFPIGPTPAPSDETAEEAESGAT